ncbi:uncharacterized protein K460DRAFT_353194 [Cucurbitaria berberidis CBS 394.84]|uniref:Uncharacterized protein n=1 Tax=Cucurbitaria berberidis CBS 394.84 TaxID=1168544 RepID=A0A9P4GM51_9PLEO|nr:uncharacterized protein K460DRAFT_353194 [Cucurbitaria berberidis CBS 394.84]KAF1848177.1 hypothetical protein K460DRAFT_353194 [Cucurbitaria berberidis CBS 394.84]
MPVDINERLINDREPSDNVNTQYEVGEVGKVENSPDFVTKSLDVAVLQIRDVDDKLFRLEQTSRKGDDVLLLEKPALLDFVIDRLDLLSYLVVHLFFDRATRKYESLEIAASNVEGQKVSVDLKANFGGDGVDRPCRWYFDATTSSPSPSSINVSIRKPDVHQQRERTGSANL